MTATTEAATTRTIAANTFAGLAGRLTIMGLGLASVAILTRYLGARGYGQYGLAFSVTQLFGLVADIGLFTVIVREIARTPERTGELAGNALTLRLALALASVAAALCVSLALPYSGSVRGAIAIAGVALVFDLLASSLYAIFHAHMQIRYASAAQVAGRALATAAIALVALADLGLHAAVATAALGAALSLAVGAALARSLAQVRPRFQRRVWSELLRSTAVLGLALAINEVYLRADTLVISLFRPLREVGLYSLAYRLLDMAVALPAVFLASVFPVISRYVATSDARLAPTVGLAAEVATAAGVAIAAGGAVLAPALITLTAGSHFQAAAPALRLLFCAGALVTVNGVFGFALIAKRRERQALWLNVSTLALNLALNFAFVPELGIEAAAAATLACELVILGGSWYLMRRHFGFFPGFRRLPASLLAGAVMAGVLWPLRDGPAPALVILGLVVYLGVLWLAGGIDRELASRWRVRPR